MVWRATVLLKRSVGRTKNLGEQPLIEGHLMEQVFNYIYDKTLGEGAIVPPPPHCVFKWILRGHLKPPPSATM